MQLAPVTKPLVTQSIDQRATSLPGGGVTMWSTDRSLVLSGPTQGLGTFTSAEDAIRAASTLSSTHNPGMAVMSWRGGFRVHDVRTASRTYVSTSPHGSTPPITRETGRSNVPFAAGNIRLEGNEHGPAYVRDDRLVALVDGTQLLRVAAGVTESAPGRLTPA